MRKSRTKFYLIASVVMLAVAAAATIPLFLARAHASEPIRIVEFAYPLSPSLDVASAAADLVVEGFVKEAGEARWNTPDGRRPQLPVKAIVRDPSLRITTRYVVSVDSILKGDLAKPESEIVFVQSGGRVGEDEVVVSDWRHLATGEHVVLFLEWRDPDDRSPGFPNESAILDKYLVAADGGALGVGVTTTVDDLYKTFSQYK